jgi:hypothetical protein
VRDKIRAFYYPDFWVQAPTLKKAILVFEEIHFMDRPSFMFGGGREGSVGMVGAASPIRPYEQSFRDNGVPLYVHEAPGGPPQGELLEKVEADLSDLNFKTRFQECLLASQHFRDLHIQPGNYGNGETHETVYQKVATIDLQQSPSPLEVFASLVFGPRKELRVSTLDILILIPLIPAAPVVITWWLPWGKWIFDEVPKYLTGPYLLYAAFTAWHFKCEWWFIILLAAAGMVLSVLAIANKAKKSSHS